MLPQPFYALAAQSGGEDHEDGLRIMVQAADKNAARPPEITPFHSERLGHGLRCIRYFGDPSDPGASLNYGWWSEEHQVYASVRTVPPEAAWIRANLDICDDFARSIWLNPDPLRDSG